MSFSVLLLLFRRKDAWVSKARKRHHTARWCHNFCLSGNFLLSSPLSEWDRHNICKSHLPKLLPHRISYGQLIWKIPLQMPFLGWDGCTAKSQWENVTKRKIVQPFADREMRIHVKLMVPIYMYCKICLVPSRSVEDSSNIVAGNSLCDEHLLNMHSQLAYNKKSII